MKKQSIAVLCFISFLLIMTVGYALFSDTLKISGTANAIGTFDMEFSDAKVINEIGSSNASAIISSDKNSLEINVPNLKYPGAYVEFNITVGSLGSIPSLLKSIESVNLTDDPTVKITYDGLEELKNVTLNQGDTQSFTLKIMWDKNSNQSSKDVNFSIKLNYEQAIRF